MATLVSPLPASEVSDPMTTQATRPPQIAGRTPEERAEIVRARRQAAAEAAQRSPDPRVAPQVADLVPGSVRPDARPVPVRPRPVAVETAEPASNVLVGLDGRPVREPVSPEVRAARLAARRANLARGPAARPVAPAVEDNDEDQDPPPPDLSVRDETLARALPQRRTRIKLSVPLLSFLAMVVLPTLVASLYYVAFAADQYVSEFRFSIRKQESSVNLGGTGGASTSGFSQADALQMMADNFVIIDYLRSRTALDELARRVDFERIYDTDIADMLTRLKSDASTEERLAYWQKTIDAAYDMTTGITTVTIRSFRPEDTLQVANALVEMSEGLVNNLQARARHDAVSFFEGEVARAEERLAASQRAVLDFRNKNQITDPTSSADGVIGTFNKLQDDLVSMRAELASLLSSMKSNAPTVQVLKSRIAAGEVELGKLRARIGNSAGVDGNRLSEVIDRYQTLQREQAFAEKLYTSALTALETARINTAMQHNYLATFVQPALAHDSMYPNRLRSIMAVLFIAVFIWIVALLSGYAIRDHAI